MLNSLFSDQVQFNYRQSACRLCLAIAACRCSGFCSSEARWHFLAFQLSLDRHCVNVASVLHRHCVHLCRGSRSYCRQVYTQTRSRCRWSVQWISSVRCWWWCMQRWWSVQFSARCGYWCYTCLAWGSERWPL